MTCELRKTLTDNGLEDFISILEENNLDREILFELTEADYRKLGIPEDAVEKMVNLFAANPSCSAKSQNMQADNNNVAQMMSVKQVTPIPINLDPVENSPVHIKLIENSFAEYVPIFDQHKLTSFDIIAKLTESDLSELGIHAIGDRKKIKELFHIEEKKPKDNNVVVTQTVKSGGTDTAGIIVSILVGAVLICIVLYYAIPRFIL
jgi:hypothetical protein